MFKIQRITYAWAFILLLAFTVDGWTQPVVELGTETYESRAASHVTSTTIEYRNLATLSSPTVAWASMTYIDNVAGRPGAFSADFSIDSVSAVWTPAINITGKSLASIHLVEVGAGISTGTITNGTFEIWVSGVIDSASPPSGGSSTDLFEPYVNIEQERENSYGLKTMNLQGYRKMRIVYQQTDATRRWPRAYVNLR